MRSLLSFARQGLLRPGDRIPPERELVSQTDLSRTGVREALQGLASIGVIEILPGRGAFVRKISPDTLIDPESSFFILERETLLHGIEVRKILDAEAIALAAERHGRGLGGNGADTAGDGERRTLGSGTSPLQRGYARKMCNRGPLVARAS